MSVSLVAKQHNETSNIINHLCKVLLPNYSINEQYLLNWQYNELLDSTIDFHQLSTIISQSVIFASPVDEDDNNTANPIDNLEYSHFQELCDQLTKLDDSEYHEFKVIIYEILLYVISLSYDLKIQLSQNGFLEYLIDLLLTYLNTSSINKGSLQQLHQPSLLSQYIRLVISFCELGCDTIHLKKLITPSLLSKSNPFVKLILLELLQEMFTKYPNHFKFALFNKQTCFPFSNDVLKKSFSIQSWFKVHHQLHTNEEPITLFVLASASSSDDSSFSTTLKVKLINYNQFIVAVENNRNGSRMEFPFNQLLNEQTSSSNTITANNQGFTHFALTYDNYANLNLFIDGEYSESIPCPEIHKVLSTWDKVYIGNEIDDKYVTENDELLVKNFTLLNIALSYEWINLLYNLGLGYDWDFKDFTNENLLDLLSHLSYRGLSNVSMKFNEINEQRTNLGAHDHHHLKTSRSTRSQRSASHDRVILDRKQSNLEVSGTTIGHNIFNDKDFIVKSLTKLKQENVLFDTHEYFQLLQVQQKSQSRPKLIYSLSVCLHNPNPIHAALYTIGGTSLILRILEASLEIPNSKVRDTIFYKALTILLTVLSNNWRLCKEFEDFNGYGILSIFLSKFKQQNKSLTFNLISNTKTNNNTNYQEESLLTMLLSFSGYDFINPYESIIINPLAYRLLILNFNLHYGSNSFEYLLFQLQILLDGCRHREHNCTELRNMKLLRKFIQFLKTSTLDDHKLTNSFKEQLTQTWSSIIRLDSSVESIKSISTYITYSLYNTDCSTTCGEIVLQVLTDNLCDPKTSIKTLKKFSRSITIHWILLLLKFKDSQTVVDCGIRLLTKLLRILGSPIIKQFFITNHGLDILTSFIKPWWDNDIILCTIFLAAFGIDTEPVSAEYPTRSIDLPAVIKRNMSELNSLVMPEFLILLNNMVLNSMYNLNLESGRLLSNPPSPIHPSVSMKRDMTLSLNVLHLVNEYLDSISIGFESCKALKVNYLSKEFLEGIVELLSYLRLSVKWDDHDIQVAMKTSFDKLIKILTEFYISNISNDHFLGGFENLSDFTKKVLLDLIFPKIFEHVNEFITVSKFVFNEKVFYTNTINCLLCYNDQLLKLNYFVNEADLDTFILCSILVIEAVANVKYAQLGRLKTALGECIQLKFLKMTDFNSLSYGGAGNLEKSLKVLLYRQLVILQKEILNNDGLANVIKILLGTVLTLNMEREEIGLDLPFNFIRTCYLMRQEDFSNGIISKFTSDKILLEEFFNNLVSKNDVETFGRLEKYPPFSRSLIKESHVVIQNSLQAESQKVIDMISVALHNGGTLGNMNSIYIKSFEKDCESLKSSTINGELLKFNRTIQDNQENDRFYISSYHSLKIEISRLYEEEKENHYVVDYIENSDRMRRRLIMEDQLPESEKLTYNLDIPLKKIDLFDNELEYDLHEYDFAIAARGIDTLSLSSNDTTFEYDGEDSFEVVESNNYEPADQDLEIGNMYEDKNRKVLRSLFVGDSIVTIWNISQINGLVPVESLMILGTHHLYLIENYFHYQDGTVIDVEEAPPELRDPVLQLVNSQSSSLLKNDSKSHRRKNWSLDTLSCISKRQFLLRDIAIEMFFSDGASILITCLTTKERDSIYSRLQQFATGKGIDHDLTQALQASSSSPTLLSPTSPLTGTSFLTSKIASAFSQAQTSPGGFITATKKWKMGELSNFYYLMIINTLAGRTFNDLTQYPVFPWVIADYTSETLDLSNPKTFRDLSKPMGAQTEIRAKQFRERFEALDSLQDPDAPAFHYGTHYSSAMIASSFLIRLKPYVQSYLLLQGGKFDHADRLFNSVEKAWYSSSRDNTTDVRELTPEFFYLPEFLVNANHFEFGKLQNGQSVNDVILPIWAKGDPKIFIAKNREALESPYVSANLHLWIDLIFGYKQSGPEAVNALNVFHHLSYNGAINLDNIKDEMEKKAVIGMINNFGQTPTKVFTKPHPRKEVLNLPNYYLTLLENNALTVVFESKMKLPIYKLEMSSKNNGKWVGRPRCVSCEDDLLIRKAHNFKYDSGSLMINQTPVLNIHSTNITNILQIGHRLFLSAAEDGIINVWKCELKPHTSLLLQAILRGHLSSVVQLCFSKSFKSGVSLDQNGVVIIWDLARFRFVRKIVPPISEAKTARITISNDTGNFATIHRKDGVTILRIYTINGDLVVTKTFNDIKHDIGVIGFSSINDPRVDTGKSSTVNHHIYWTNEIFAIAFGQSIELWELVVNENGWALKSLGGVVNLENRIHGSITAFELFKCSEVDGDIKLSRGSLKLIIGDSTGTVYSL
ncbi:BPH1 [[Candida] subhashii]|uniref:BPH1 n=1 Tax=[Candida] subhashii TaxID=561895 RepID=A0A8J5V274_9ASCO|nr:BPH1 [[Candida] subhashii]KAG7666110.1 BPH1 [[Candida] subhashii]